jgi:hypothetical protein
MELKIIVLIGLIPASIILTSITMREVYQMFFICATIYFTTKYTCKKRIIYMIFMLCSLFLFATLHASFKYYAVIYLFGLICFEARGFAWSLKLKFKFFLLFIMSWILLFIDVSLLHAIILKFVEGTSGAEDARAYYGLPLIEANIFSVINFMVISFFNYMVRPFPWEITSLVDILPLFENSLRLFFIWRIYQLRGHMSAAMTWALFAAMLLELLWGMGTLNWGTAQRHHLVAWPLFVVIYSAAVSRSKVVKSINTLSKLTHSSVAV